ncbi:MAG: metalloprotease TldD, partial [Betaproteobacteria bacterium]|nr:metalloprotease TldD [Betaproteobacteria bacterium]
MNAPTQLLQTAQSCLLAPNDLDRSNLSGIFGSLASRRLDFADLYFQYSRSEGWSLEEGIVKSGSFNIDQGVGVRAISGEKTAFAYSDEISAPALKDAAKATRAIAQSGQHGAARVPAARARQSKALARAGEAHALYPASDPLGSLADNEKVMLLERLERLCRGMDPRVAQVMASLAAEYEVVLVARSDGHFAADVRPLVRLSVQVIAEQDGRREQGSAGGGGRGDLAYFTEERLREYAKRAVSQALVNLEARPAPAGAMTVVLGPGWPGVLLHEAIGHGLEGDFNRKGSSAFSGRIGERVASRGVTVVDDGTLPGRRGSLNVDDEGNPTQCTTLIEDGVLRGYIQDSLNARLMGAPVTGNGRRESFAHIVLPRMTNTYMLNGERSPQEIIESVKDGIYAVNFGGGQVDITNGKFVFSASEAYRIENGKVTYPVKGATLI